MSDYSVLNDRQLIERLAAQDQQALAQLYARYGGPVYSLCMRVLGQPTLAEEVTQDTFLKVWHNPGAWQPDKGRFASWLLTVARYTAIDRLRAEQRQVTDGAGSLEDVQIVDVEGQPDSPLLRDGRLLAELIAQLPPEQAHLITLGFFHGYTHRELAERLGLPLGTVKTRIRLGLNKLRDLWAAAHAEPATSENTSRSTP